MYLINDLWIRMVFYNYNCIYVYDLQWYRCNLNGKTWFENIMQGIIIVIIKGKLLSWKYNLLSGLFLFCDTKVILKTSIVK